MNDEFKPWQLAPDHETYGDDAGKWVITAADGEHEIGNAVYGTEAACIAAIELISAGKAVIGNWEHGDLAAAVRRLSAALEIAGGGT
jgi:hypothetical protein